MAKHDREYDWFNDPFDDKKNAEELQRIQNSKTSGCLIVVVILIVIVVLGAAAALFGVMTQYFGLMSS